MRKTGLMYFASAGRLADRADVDDAYLPSRAGRSATGNDPIERRV